MQNLLEKFPNEIDALEILSELYLLNDEKEKAFDIFKQLAIIAPENGRIHLTLADYYRDNGDNTKSFEELKLAFKNQGVVRLSAIPADSPVYFRMRIRKQTGFTSEWTHEIKVD